MIISSHTKRGGTKILFQAINGILIPLWGTIIGATIVFFARKRTSVGISTLISGFSSGVMVAASIWSLLIPAIELAEARGQLPALPPAVGFAIGITFFLFFDRLISRRRQICAEHGGKPTPRVLLTCFAVSLHNLPEGMAVGAVFAEALAGGTGASLSAAMALSIGIAVQNLPEGAIISLPLYSCGTKKTKAFFCGALSGIVEPLGAFVTLLAAGIAVPLLPYLLGFAAGAMMYAVLDGDLCRGTFSDKKQCFGVASFAAGFILMMSLDVLLG